MPRSLFTLGPLARRLLLACLGVALLPLVTALGLSYRSGRDVITGLLSDHVGTTARLYASEVDHFLGQRTVLLEAVASSVPSDDASLSAVVDSSPTLEELLIVDASGTVVARSRHQAAWAVDACGSSMGAAVRAEHAAHGAGHEVVIGVPRPQGGRLCGRVSFTLHQDMISERARSSFGGLAYIVDQQGDVVCHAFHEDEPHLHPGQAITGQAATRARAGRPWQGLVEHDGAWHLAAFAPAKSLPWGVWTEVPLAEASAPLRALTTRALALGTVLIALLAMSVWWLARRFAQPIEALAAASHRIAAGEIGETVPVRGNDELAALAREFNAMSTALAQAVADLDRKVLQRTTALDDARRFSDLLLDTVEQRILVIDSDRRVLRANRSARAAYGDAIVGERCAMVHQHHAEQEGPCPTERVLSTGAATTVEVTRRVGDATEILSIESYPIADQLGQPAVLEIERDITELTQLQARVIHQEKMAALGTLAAGLAHEIGNPLASLSSELELLGRQPERTTEALPVLEAQVRRMGRLLRELVDLGRAPSEARGPLDIELVVDDVFRLLRAAAADRSVTLRRRSPSSPLPAVESSRDRLMQVLLNLCINAIDASPEGAEVSVEVQATSTNLTIHVSDQGSGLPEGVAEQLFHPFFTTKAPGKGSGLGLFVVDRIIASLGGTVSATNCPAGGAVFTLTLPLSAGGSLG